MDKLICKTCSGKKVIVAPSGKVEICPKCGGTGHIVTEEQKKNKQLILG